MKDNSIDLINEAREIITLNSDKDIALGHELMMRYRGMRIPPNSSELIVLLVNESCNAINLPNGYIQMDKQTFSNPFNGRKVMVLITHEDFETVSDGDIKLQKPSGYLKALRCIGDTDTIEFIKNNNPIKLLEE